MKLLHITAASVCGPRALRLVFDDGTRKSVDLTPLLVGPVFETLRRAASFAKVRLDARTGTVCWPNGADFAPEALKRLPALRMRKGAARRSARPNHRAPKRTARTRHGS
jgi:hypothetical protein